MAEQPTIPQGQAKGVKPRVYRVSEIPASWSSDTFETALRRLGLNILPDVRILPSVLTKGKCTATLALRENSEILQDLSKHPMNDKLINVEGTHLVFDQHFYGLTTIYSPSGEIKADLIAIHGLSGHAFGSWANFDASSTEYIMWLKDFLGPDVATVRIMVYGYEARLDKTTTMSRLVDYRRSFIGELLSCRRENRDRPLILFGHSFGGTIIGQALSAAKMEQEKPELMDILRSIHGIFFFGVPHRGFRTAEISKMTEGRSEESKKKLLADIEKDSETLRHLLDVLAALCIDFQVVSIYEELQTPSIVRSGEGTWKSTGAPQTLVEESSAVLHLPNEVKIPALADHRTIVKHIYRDRRYHQVKDEVVRIVQSPKIAAHRLKRQHLEQYKVRRNNCAGLDFLGIAFAYSGVANSADNFISLYEDFIAGCEVFETTDPGFVLFRLLYWRFKAWIQTMRAAWETACANSSSLIVSSAQIQFDGFNISSQLGQLIQKALSLLHKVQSWKEDRASIYKTNDTIDGAQTSPFEPVNKQLNECICNLESFMPEEMRRSLLGETLAAALTTSNDIATMRKLEEISSGFSSTANVAQSVRVKRELLDIKHSTSTETSMVKLCCNLQESAVKSRHTVVMTTYREGTHFIKVLVEWSPIDHRWDSAEIQLARNRISRLARELSIENKPTSLCTLQAFGFVEDMNPLDRRFGMLYRMPHDCAIGAKVYSLAMLLPGAAESNRYPEPLLGERFALARTLAESVHGLHTSGWLHKSISSHSVIFLGPKDSNEVITNPYVIGFGYSRPDDAIAVSLAQSTGVHDLYQHPEVRQNDAAISDSQDVRIRFRRSYDLYSLGIILLEIGIWDRVSVFNKDGMDPWTFRKRLLKVCDRDLGHRMGRTYRDVVKRCIQGVVEDKTESTYDSAESEKSDDMMDVYWGVLNELSKCHCK